MCPNKGNGDICIILLKKKKKPKNNESQALAIHSKRKHVSYQYTVQSIVVITAVTLLA